METKIPFEQYEPQDHCSRQECGIRIHSREEHRAFFHEEAYFKHPVQVISPTYQLSTLQIYVQDCASHHKVTSMPFVSSTGQDC